MGALLDVLLRGLALAAQSVVVGGAVFVLVVLRPWASARGEAASEAPLVGLATRARRLIIGAALVVAVAQSGALVLALAALGDDRGWPVAAALSTVYFRTGLARLALAIVAALLAVAARHRERERWTWWMLTATGAGLVLAAAGTSHAAARLEHRALLVSVDALHQLAAGVWIGGLTCLIVLRFARAEFLPRFSAVALTAVAVLVAAGVTLTTVYVGGIGGLLGTAYGVMVLTKVIVLAGLLALGGANFRAVRALAAARPVSVVKITRYVEVELGLGLTVLLAASSLTSLPPADDVVTDRATLAEVATRFTPRWPTLTSPRIDQMPVADREAPRTDEDRAWSEYNHHVAGLFVLAIGFAAMAHEIGGRRWARHWPLLLLGLGAFLLVRDDPGAWPLGPMGFWESMWDPAVLQHRFFVLLVVAFGIFEWMVRTDRLRSPRWALVFPGLCAVGGGVLLTHSHAMLNLKSEFLVEVTHTPLALFGMVVGWGRWLQLRQLPPDDRLPGRMWSVALALVGVVLLLYRES